MSDPLAPTFGDPLSLLRDRAARPGLRDASRLLSERKGRRAVTHVRRQFGPAEGVHGTTEGLEGASSDGRWLLGVAVGGSAMAFLDGTVVNVALPDIGRNFGAGTSELQWVLNTYLLALASLILLGGSLGDRFGRVRIFLIGIVLFSLASGLCAAAPDVDYRRPGGTARGSAPTDGQG